MKTITITEHRAKIRKIKAAHNKLLDVWRLDEECLRVKCLRLELYVERLDRLLEEACKLDPDERQSGRHCHMVCGFSDLRRQFEEEKPR